MSKANHQLKTYIGGLYKMSKLLINENPLQVLPSLATKIGLNEAIILQQLHYWNEVNKKQDKNFHDGYYWTYNSYDDWQEQFPFWSTRTIQRAINKLERMMLIVSGNYNKLKIDRTKWYRIDYETLKYLEEYPLRQNVVINETDWLNYLDKVSRPLPETTTETNNKDKLYIAEDKTNVPKGRKVAEEYPSDYEPDSSLDIYKEALDFYEKMPRKDSNIDQFIPMYKKARNKHSKEVLDICLDRYLEDKKLKGESIYHKPCGFFREDVYSMYLDENWTKTLEDTKKQVKIRESNQKRHLGRRTNSVEPQVTEEWDKQIDELGWD